MVRAQGARHTTRKCADGEIRIRARAFNPDGKVLASEFMDRTVRLWDDITGRALHEKPMWGHTEVVSSVLAFSPRTARW